MSNGDLHGYQIPGGVYVLGPCGAGCRHASHANDGIPPLLADICTAAANSVDAQASVSEHPDRYVVTFGRSGSDAIATLVVQKQLFADAIDWGERRIRAELEHEAAKVCAMLKGAP